MNLPCLPAVTGLLAMNHREAEKRDIHTQTHKSHTHTHTLTRRRSRRCQESRRESEGKRDAHKSSQCAESVLVFLLELENFYYRRDGHFTVETRDERNGVSCIPLLHLTRLVTVICKSQPTRSEYMTMNIPLYIGLPLSLPPALCAIEYSMRAKEWVYSHSSFNLYSCVSVYTIKRRTRSGQEGNEESVYSSERLIIIQ